MWSGRVRERAGVYILGVRGSERERVRGREGGSVERKRQEGGRE